MAHITVDPTVLAVIDALYAAALDDSLWPHALAVLTAFTHSDAATFWVLNPAHRPTLPLFTSVNIDPTFVRDYVDNAAHLDPTVQYLVAHPHQAVVHDGLVITERDKDRHPYYDWHGRHSDLRFRVVGQVCPAPGMQAGVALHRTRQRGRYESTDLDRFEYLHRHLERALQVAFRLGSLDAMQQSSADVLDRDSAAVILLDKDRRVVYTNRRADALRVDADGITFLGNTVGLQQRSDDAVLQRFIMEMMSIGRAPAGPRARVLRAERPSGKRAYAILVTAVIRQYASLSTIRPAVCIVVSDPDADAVLPEELVRRLFGLTSAQARLAARLAAGEDLKTAAEHLGITYGSARTRLAEIYEKTDTRRQGELIRLLLTTITKV